MGIYMCICACVCVGDATWNVDCGFDLFRTNQVGRKVRMHVTPMLIKQIALHSFRFGFTRINHKSRLAWLDANTVVNHRTTISVRSHSRQLCHTLHGDFKAKSTHDTSTCNVRRRKRTICSRCKRSMIGRSVGPTALSSKGTNYAQIHVITIE